MNWPKRDRPDAPKVEIHSQKPHLERPSICSNEGCGKKASWTPLWRIHAIGHPPDRFLEMEMGLSFCDEHKSTERMREMFSLEHNPLGNAYLKDALRMQLLAEPDLEDVDVAWREL